MSCDLFLKTFCNDAEWLQYLFRSIDKFCEAFRNIVVVCPPSMKLPKCKLPVVRHDREEGEKPYLGQQAHKLYADIYSSADLILHIDSDCVFTRPVCPESFCENGKPIWLMTAWEHIDKNAIAAWFPVMLKFFGEPPPFECMRRHPQVIPRWLYPELRGYCLGKHGQTLWNYIHAQENRAFSEFNVAGEFARKFHFDRFAFRNTHTDSFPPDYVRQFWSYGGIEEVRPIIETILAA